LQIDENTNEQPSPRRTVPDVLANVLVSIPSKDALEQNNITRWQEHHGKTVQNDHWQ
jgi:hypothetical protein